MVSVASFKAKARVARAAARSPFGAWSSAISMSRGIAGNPWPGALARTNAPAGSFTRLLARGRSERVGLADRIVDRPAVSIARSTSPSSARHDNGADGLVSRIRCPAFARAAPLLAALGQGVGGDERGLEVGVGLVAGPLGFRKGELDQSPGPRARRLAIAQLGEPFDGGPRASKSFSRA